MSLIRDLDDHAFGLAVEYITELCREMEEGAERKPTLNDLCELLTWGIRCAPDDILADVNPCNVEKLVPKVKKKGRVNLRPGDLIAVPNPRGKYYYVVFIKRNRFGYAMGIIKGEYSLKPPPPDWQPEVLRHPVYTDNQYIAEGRWKIIGNYPHLLKLFPSDPEIYHFKSFYPDDDRIGPYGSGETSDGTLRPVSKEEAEELGLLDETYRVGYNDSYFEEFLEKKLGSG